MFSENKFGQKKKCIKEKKKLDPSLLVCLSVLASGEPGEVMWRIGTIHVKWSLTKWSVAKWNFAEWGSPDDVSPNEVREMKFSPNQI